MMNDTEFENILKQALRPDISDEEILIKETPSRSKRRKSTMRKHRIIQSAIAAAACLALIWGIGYKTIKPEKAQNTAVTNSFVVKVNAAEIKHTKKNQMRVYANPGYTSMWCGGEAGKQFVSYSINAPLQFEGNNIKTVTYRINKGHFFVTKAEHSKYFKEGDTQRNVLTEFNSNNTELLNVEQVQQKLLSLSYIREELEAMKNK